jgi:hypothetical protein
LTEQFCERILDNPDLMVFFGPVAIEQLKKVHKSIIGLVFDKDIFFSLDNVKRAHSNLQIKNTHFDQMKMQFVLQMIDAA